MFLREATLGKKLLGKGKTASKNSYLFCIIRSFNTSFGKNDIFFCIFTASKNSWPSLFDILSSSFLSMMVFFPRSLFQYLIGGRRSTLGQPCSSFSCLWGLFSHIEGKTKKDNLALGKDLI